MTARTKVIRKNIDGKNLPYKKKKTKNLPYIKIFCKLKEKRQIRKNIYDIMI